MFRPLNEWILVEVPEKKQRTAGGGSIILVEDKNQVMVGKVLAVGKGIVRGDKQIPLGVEPGEYVAFFSGNFETSPGRLMRETLSKYDDTYGLVRARDVLFVTEPGVEVEVD